MELFPGAFAPNAAMLLTPYTILDLNDERLVECTHGVIETAGGRFVRIELRPFPKWVTPWELIAQGDWYHRRFGQDRCRLYFNHSARLPEFMALKYVYSGRGTRLASFRLALRVLDEVARRRGVSAIVCDAANFRISGRLLARWGWASHCPSRWHRNHIKRFYGKFPQPLVFDPLGYPVADEQPAEQLLAAGSGVQLTL
ncbi:MAG: hypothetical protein K1X74_05070 [Pirellulales bacterium]|nr:hypothetical protein [Pirellulales bacterium]